MQVLIVDDSRATRRFVERVLDMSGLEIGDCLQAADGREALRILADQPVDLVLTDINMPRMNGEQFLRAMQSSPDLRSVPVVIVSTDATDNRRARVFALGAKGYVIKPVTPEALREELERVLDQGRETTPDQALSMVCPVRCTRGGVEPLLDVCVSHTLETMCFSVVDSVEHDTWQDEESAVAVEVRFGGDAVGSLVLVISGEAAFKMAADFHGVELDELDREQVESFAGELANVISGGVLGWCKADGHFEITAPEVIGDLARRTIDYWHYTAVYHVDGGAVSAALHLGLVDAGALAIPHE